MAYASTNPVIYADEQTRASFLVRVYQHLGLAVAAFIAFETLLFLSGIAEGLYNFLARSGGFAWLLILGGFLIVGNLATRSAHNLENVGAQYGGLFGMAAIESLIFAPFLYYVFNYPGAGGSLAVGSAAVVTGIGFAGLTAIGLLTRKDLSFLRPLIMWGSFVAIGLILAAVLFSFQLGVVFTIAMIGLAGASILYQTQTILRSYPEWAHVGAAVSLFASLMMLFWHVLRLFSRR